VIRLIEVAATGATGSIGSWDPAVVDEPVAATSHLYYGEGGIRTLEGRIRS